MRVNMSDYAASAVGGDWSLAIEAAYAAVQAAGGLINWDVQDMEMKTNAALSTGGGVLRNLTLEGDGSNQLYVNPATMLQMMSIANTGKLSVRGLNWHGLAGSALQDCDTLATHSFTHRTIYDGCTFAGVHSDVLLEFLQSVSAVVRDCYFGGNNGINIKASGVWSLTVENCTFLDYFVLNGDYYDLGGGQPTAWIECDAALDPTVNFGASTPQIAIRNCIFDEGAVTSIKVTGYPNVQIENISANMNGTSTGSVVNLDGVKNAIIRQVHGGYVGADYPIVRLTNCEYPVLIGIGVDDKATPHPVHIEVDAFSATNLKLLQSPDVTVTVV